MDQGRIIVITGSPGTGKTTTASTVAKESDLEKSVHMHTDDFYHYLSKGAIPPYLPESNEQNLIVIEAFLEAVTAAMFQAMRDALAEQKQNPLSIDDVAAMVAGQIGQLTPMDEETADLFKQLAKKMMKGIE